MGPYDDRARLRLPLRATQQRAHPRHELVRAERLRDVIVRADLEPDDPLRLVGAGRQHDDRNGGGPRLAAHDPADLKTVHLRQHQVEHQQVGRTIRERLERLPPGGQEFGGKPRLLQITLDELRDVPIVLDDEDPCAHVVAGPAATPLMVTIGAASNAAITGLATRSLLVI